MTLRFPAFVPVASIAVLLFGRNAESLPLPSEITTHWSDISISFRRTSFGLTPSPPQARSKITCEEWVGTWDTVTSEGNAFTIQFFKQEGRVEGFIPNASRSFAGRFYGMPNPVGDEITFTFTRPTSGEVDRGKLWLTTRETFAGTFVKDSAPNKTLTLRGTRKQ
jgi:hypothetical protein